VLQGITRKRPRRETADPSAPLPRISCGTWMESFASSIRSIQCEWKRCPILCHPERSRGICSSAEPVLGMFFGRSVAKWRDLQLVLPALLIFVAGGALAQQIGQNTSSTSGTYTLTAKAQLVVETVVVKDKQGKFVPGLTAKDFTVTEDGTPQTIKFCEHQNLAAEQTPVPAAAPGTEQIKIYKQLSRTQIAPEAREHSL
jgi:hypothetical protein